MTDYFYALIIGIVEGLTEFLPVSSTAHIRLTQQALGISQDSEYWKMFAVVIQLGAILSVVVYFRQRLTKFVFSFIAQSKTSIGSGRGSYSDLLRHPLSRIAIAFVVTAIPCYLIDKWIDDNLESNLVIALALIIGGIVMWLVDLRFGDRGHTTSLEQVSLFQAIAIGATQILAAAFPGTSRSMATIAGGQLTGLSRQVALEFSFFLSIPVMVAAAAYKLLKYVVHPPVAMTGHDWIVLTIGFATSFLVAWVVIAWFMNWVKRRGFVPFAIYRLILGAMILAFWRN